MAHVQVFAMDKNRTLHPCLTNNEGKLETTTKILDDTSQVSNGSIKSVQIQSGSTISITTDQDRRQGWYITNPLGGDFIQWTFFDGTNHSFTQADILKIFVNVYVDNATNLTSYPLIRVYTKPTGVGDFDPSYHSRFTYKYLGELIENEKIMMYSQKNTSYVPENIESLRAIKMDDITIDGDGLSSEEILYIKLETDSTAPISTIECCFSSFGFQLNGYDEQIYKLIDPNIATTTETNSLGILSAVQNINANTNGITYELVFPSITQSLNVHQYPNKKGSYANVESLGVINIGNNSSIMNVQNMRKCNIYIQDNNTGSIDTYQLWVSDDSINWNFYPVTFSLYDDGVNRFFGLTQPLELSGIHYLRLKNLPTSITNFNGVNISVFGDSV